MAYVMRTSPISGGGGGVEGFRCFIFFMKHFACKHYLCCQFRSRQGRQIYVCSRLRYVLNCPLMRDFNSLRHFCGAECIMKFTVVTS